MKDASLWRLITLRAHDVSLWTVVGTLVGSVYYYVCNIIQKFDIYLTTEAAKPQTNQTYNLQSFWTSYAICQTNNGDF